MTAPPVGLTVYSCEPDEADAFRARAPRFGVVPTITSDPVSERSVPGSRCISVGHKSAVSAAIVRALGAAGVEYISTRSIGFDHIDVAAAERAGITVENVVYAADGVADFTLMLILMVVRNAKAMLGAVDRHDFRHGPGRGGDLCDMTVGVVGVGHIGRAVVRRLQGFGCRVLACNDGPLDELLRASDIVTLHAPLNAATHHLVGRDQIAKMKPGAILINTGRGALVDTGALVDALERGHLGGAALDVLEDEEGIFSFERATRPFDHPRLRRLQQLPNVVVTPHTAYYTARMLRDTVENTLMNCLRFERNRAHEEAHDRGLVRGLLGGA